MADVAHDAPASPRPGDVAPQQASRPDSPDRGKLRVFISYSRDDLDFADQLNAALDACGLEFARGMPLLNGDSVTARCSQLISSLNPLERFDARKHDVPPVKSS